jgi:hypothetical protein
MKIGSVPPFFAKTDSAGKIENLREIQNIRWKIKFPADFPDFQRNTQYSAGKLKNLPEK